MENQKIKTEWVRVWKQGFQVTLINKKGYALRLNELKTWDKPLNPRESDPNGKWVEWEAKIQALEELLN